MSRMLPRFGAALLALAGFAAGAVAQAPDYHDAAQKFVQANGLTGLPEGEAAIGEALSRGFATLPLGLFEVSAPWSALVDGHRIDELRDVLLGLLDLELRARAWLDVERGDAPPPASAATLRAWIKGWKGDALKKTIAARPTEQSLADFCGADAGEGAAISEFADACRSGAFFGAKLDGSHTQLVLAPTRESFVGLVAFLGEAKADWKPLAWTASLPMQVEFHANQFLVVALVAPAFDGNPAGLPLDGREKTGLFQHVTQYAADRMLRQLFGGKLDPGLHAGLAVDLVIDLYGENNARLFGNKEGNLIPARERFVPGGRSQGGKLSARSADSRWRSEKGRDWFAKQLKAGQTEGGKIALKLGETAPSPLAHFVLDCSTNPGAHDIANAPLLGEFATKQAMPENFAGDYQEFLRAYRSLFVHWLATEAKPASGAKRGAARLLRARLEQPDRPLDEIATEIFGVALTAPDPAGKALEWQFLAWLSTVRI